MDAHIPVTVPVLLILFNRPAHTRQVIERLRLVSPTVIYVAIDGPRNNHPRDLENITACKSIISDIDWPCTVQTLFSQDNLGCKYAVSSAINWFFNHVEQGIILEDDCLPSVTFFNFCQELLTRYETDERIMHIGGANLFSPSPLIPDAYSFTKICHIWGWATWRRAWQYYDVAIKSWEDIDQTAFIKSQLEDQESIKYWKQIFNEVFAGKINTWDYQWVFTIWLNNGLCVLPKYNLVTNIGFDESATHTVYKSPFANLPSSDFEKIIHPLKVEDNKSLTKWLAERLYRLPSIFEVLRMKAELHFKWLKV